MFLLEEEKKIFNLAQLQTLWVNNMPYPQDMPIGEIVESMLEDKQALWLNL